MLALILDVYVLGNGKIVNIIGSAIACPTGCGVTDVCDGRLQGAEGDGEELKTF